MNMDMKTAKPVYSNKTLGKRIWQYRWIYLLLLPGIVQVAIFAYGPMYGIQLAFRNHNFFDGIWGSPFVGLEHFRRMFSDPMFFRALRNTLTLAFMNLIVGFPVPIILAILINEIRNRKFSRTLQTIFTFPNFLSWIIISGIVFQLFGSAGVINTTVQTFFPNWGNSVLRSGHQFRWMLVFSQIWQSAGWTSIMYLAAITGIDPGLYESATIDGAGRFQRIWYITWPGMRFMALMMLILAAGGLLSGNFDQIFQLHNANVLPQAEILSIYNFRLFRGLMPNYGYITALGLFTGIINGLLLLTANRISAKIRGESVFAANKG